MKAANSWPIMAMALVLLGFVLSIYSINRQIKPPAATHAKFQLEIDTNLQLASFYQLPDTTQSITAIKPVVQMDSELLAYNLNPKLMVWALVFSILFGLALGSVPLSIGRSAYLIRIFGISWKAVFGSIAGILVFFVLVLYVSSGEGSGKLLSAVQLMMDFKILFFDPKAIEVMITIVVLTGSFAAYGILLINFCAPRVLLGEDQSAMQRFSKLKLLDDNLNVLLGVISILIMLSVVALSVLHQAIQGQFTVVNANIFPSEFIYAYGLVFTIFLAIIYLPTHFHLNQILLEMKQTADDMGLQSEEHSKMVLGGTLSKNFQVLFAIIAPLIGSALTEMLQQVAF
ncbi:hypothetical protein [Mariniradius sediminis]|uniref:Uncharacterized protein n=1 Tax=Mariniradius sediminis TaxID=2909237 RepID=A0ABS9BSH5_9BACT|nr:hypothetical protein [Mariniradius sediminis]MCF1751031.1 hypothetical protein [Mariniradius sediminis]